MRYDQQSKLMKIAIEYGCKTAKDLARFLREYNLERLLQEHNAQRFQLSY